MRKLLIHELLYRIMYSLSKEGYTEIDLKDLENFLIKASQKPVFKIMFENIDSSDNKINLSDAREFLIMMRKTKIIEKDGKEYLTIPDFSSEILDNNALVDNLTNHYLVYKNS